MDCAGDAVQHLHVELRKHECLVDAGIADVTLRGGIHHVAHREQFEQRRIAVCPRPCLERPLFPM